MAVPLNLVVAGDGCVSKNCLLTTYYSGVFPTEWQPAVTYELEKDVMVDGKPVTLNLHYTNGMVRILCTLFYFQFHGTIFE